MNKSMRWLLSTSLLVAVGCKGIPNSYIGQYQDESRRVTLELDTFEGDLQVDGRNISAKLEELKFDKLKEAKQAIYARENARNNDLVEIYLLLPNNDTRQEANGLMWYESEIFYTLANAKDSNAAKNMTLIHCQRGMVLLDLATSQVQLGCGERVRRLQLRKTRDGRPGNDWPSGVGGSS